MLKWNFFTDGDPSSSNPDFVYPTVGLPVVSLSRGTGATSGATPSAFSTAGFGSDGINELSPNNDYYEFSLEPQSGETIELTRIKARVGGDADFIGDSDEGALNQFFYSENGGVSFSPIGDVITVLTNDSLLDIDLTEENIILNTGDEIIFRFYASSNTGAFPNNTPINGVSNPLTLETSLFNCLVKQTLLVMGKATLHLRYVKAIPFLQETLLILLLATTKILYQLKMEGVIQ